MNPGSNRVIPFAAAILAFSAVLVSRPASASSDPLLDLLTANSGTAVGAALRPEQSLYRGAGVRYDLVPLFAYEGEFAFLHAYRAGLKLSERADRRIDIFLAHRFESFPFDRIPASLAGMAGREPGLDAGVGYEQRNGWGRVFAEYLHDVSGLSKGSELRLGYSFSRRNGRVQLSPSFILSARDANLNNYYYGVMPAEAAADRPAYQPSGGINATFGLYARYDLSDRWQLLAGISAARWASGVRHSPIVDDRALQFSGFAGFAYDFAPKKEEPRQENEPLIVKALHGKSTDCNLLPIMRFGCTSTNTVDHTGVDAIELGRPIRERLNGWPVDIVGYLSLLHHDERGLQPDSTQANAYLKAFYYGFPWSGSVRTRIGFGAGLSYAQRVPFVEARDQAARGRNTSKLLLYLDPSIDVSIGDVFGTRSLRETYFGFGVSHRSGIFGYSQMFGNVDGGSNYIYTYVEWRM
jgi:outer membrane protein